MKRRWFCTDCSDTFRSENESRCPICGGARVIGPVKEDEPVTSNHKADQ
jgi:rRNA maturation endonuclease Nob1